MIRRRANRFWPLLVIGALASIPAFSSPVGAQRLALSFPVEFSIPSGMESRVRFWVDVFSRHSLSEAIVHDREHPQRVLAIVPMRRGNRKERDTIRKRYVQLLESLSKSGPEQHEAILQSFDGPLNRRWLATPANNVRIQPGQAEVFYRSLERSRYYSRTVRRELKERNLPALLAHLPHIESSYNPLARSRAGAVGLWQLMPRTARQYIRVGRRNDERRDPLRSSYAAARYLATTHQRLGSWPLAVTAYNHGPSALGRAIERHGTADLGELIVRHEDSRFGFAGKNFYAQFLAAAHVAENASHYFPDIDTTAIVTHTVKRGDTLWDIARAYGISVRSLQRVNHETLSRSRYLKPGVRLIVEG